MSDFPKRLYMIVFPTNALVASQLEPDKFAEHYTMGSAKHYNGKVIFAEIDINYRDPYFDIDYYLEQTHSHETGEPKKTKFISSYGVLEHISLDAIKKLYLVTTSGKILPLEPAEYTIQNEPNRLRIYQEVCPLETLVASNLDQRTFGKYIAANKAKGAPKILFTQLEFDIPRFLDTNKNKDIYQIELPGVNPYRFHDCITELSEKPEKQTKTISLSSLLRSISYKFLRHGFWFATMDDMKFFPMPPLQELEDKYFYWWKHVR